MQPTHEIISNENSDLASAACPGKRFDSLFTKLLFVIPIGVIGNLIFSYAFADHTVMYSVARLSPVYLAIALFLGIVPWFTGSLRMFIWSSFLGKDVRYRDIVNIAINAELGAAVSPPLVGGGPVKIGMLMQRGFSGAMALSLTTLESFEDALFFLLMVPIALTVSSAWDLPIIRKSFSVYEHRSFWIFLGAACILVFAGAILARSRSKEIMERFPLMRTIARHIKFFSCQFIGIGREIMQKGKIVLALTMTLTMIQWACRYSIISLLLLGLGIPPRPLLFMALQVIVFALLTFIPTPGGAGGAEALFYAIYRSFLPTDMIGVVTAGWRFITFYFLLFMASGIVLFSRLKAAVPLSAPSGGMNDINRS